MLPQQPPPQGHRTPRGRRRVINLTAKMKEKRRVIRWVFNQWKGQFENRGRFLHLPEARVNNWRETLLGSSPSGRRAGLSTCGRWHEGLGG
mmetsp:Transcript_72248/g.186334  ORF Transcript_72248/g.186334 Transcript_72248/m.186334 type:complete len:91 (+) Transcript_72248:130-402(+)